jgi:hypothetical protein
LQTDEITVLQAFAIFLTAAWINNSARRIWTLTALLVRLAQNFGVDRDGIHFNLSPFVVEMRRRLWWCICVLDSRACEDTGYDATILPQSYDTRLPLNATDSDLFQGTTELPQSRVGHTDIWSLMSCVLSRPKFFGVCNISWPQARAVNLLQHGISRAEPRPFQISKPIFTNSISSPVIGSVGPLLLVHLHYISYSVHQNVASGVLSVSKEG